ncbi:beta-galactosidase [bacterium]|nr:beta-galactosidase [bacterium]
MTNDFLRFRQIHLDFHTSEAIAGIGAAFDAEAWAEQLVAAHVDSITCFARCHHGWIYYDTQKHPERRHPHLERNLLVEQINVAHAAGIRVPIYTTVMWDHYTAEQHPEWLQMDETGRVIGTPPFEAGFYRKLCLNSPYVDFLKDHVREMFEVLPAVDGFFFDIVHPQECACFRCKANMLAQGLNPADAAQRKQFGMDVMYRFMDEMSAFVRSFDADATIFYNGGHVGPRHRPVKDTFSHWELESLPSGGWGYIHFPLAVRYARPLGIDYLGMTGKFHTSWGDFHSYKNPAALQFECFQMLANNAKCSIGDQLHPSGELDDATYKLVGSIYAEVKKKEPWCRGAVPVVEIGVFTPEEFTGERHTPQTMAAVKMLQQGGYQFDILDSQSDFAPYRVLILPDVIPTDAAFVEKLTNFLARGGGLIASFESGMDAEKRGFVFDALGVSLAEDGARDAQGRLVRGRNFVKGDYLDYLRVGDILRKGLWQTDYAMYMRGMQVLANPGTQILGETVSSYFDRTWAHFCSHRQTPSSGEVSGPAVVRKGNAIYFAHPIFGQYQQNAPRWCKLLLFNALDELLPQPILRHQGPSTVVATVNEQVEPNRWIVHLLHYIPERRGEEFDVIEDMIPLHDLTLSVVAPQPVTSVRTAPQGEAIQFAEINGRVNFTLTRLEGHQMVEIVFA